MTVMDFDEAVKLFLTYCKAKRLAERTLQTYWQACKGLVRPSPVRPALEHHPLLSMILVVPEGTG
jgi:hypothetical protein